MKSFVGLGAHSCCAPWSFNITSIGKEVTGFSTLIFNPDDNGEGEVSCSLNRTTVGVWLTM